MEARKSTVPLPEGFAGDVTLAEARAGLPALMRRAEDGPIAIRGPQGELLGALLSRADVEFFLALEDANDHAASRAALQEPGERIPLERLAADLGL